MATCAFQSFFLTKSLYDYEKRYNKEITKLQNSQSVSSNGSGAKIWDGYSPDFHDITIWKVEPSGTQETCWNNRGSQWRAEYAISLCQKIHNRWIYLVMQEIKCFYKLFPHSLLTGEIF